jgi:catechol-2,3-dioxygenase
MPGWGIRCFHLQDPDGNLIEINQHLPEEQWDQALSDKKEQQ